MRTKPRDVVSYLTDRLGEEDIQVTIRGVTYDLREEVRIPRAGEADLDDVLFEHVERKAAWELLVARAEHDYEAAKAAYDEACNLKFAQAWNTLESDERAEMEFCLLDESEEDLDEFRRRKRVSERIARGPKLKVRWNRNFTDAKVWSWVHTMSDVQDARKALAASKLNRDLARVILNTFDHRMRCLSHLCARARDNT